MTACCFPSARGLIAAVIMLGSACAMPAFAAGRKLAVVVGVDAYRTTANLPKLQHAGADAASLSEVLREQGFTVYEMTQSIAKEEGQEAMTPILPYIRDQIDGVLGFPNLGADDTVIISLHGHGVQFDDGKPETSKFYFCPADATVAGAKTNADLSDRNRLLPLDELYAELANCKAATKLLIVDACRNDPTKPSVFRSGLASSTLPKLPPPTGGTAAFFSCKADQQSVEDPELKQGVFTHYLVEGLRGKADQPLLNQPADGIVTFAELSAFVANNTYAHVYNTYKMRQSPELRGDYDLNFPLSVYSSEVRKRLADAKLVDYFQRNGFLDHVTLYPGKSAPPLPDLEFIEGERLDHFEKGKVYVVETFASWCSPCLSKQPFMSKLQQKYPSIVCLTVDISGSEDARAFLKRAPEIEDEEFAEWWRKRRGWRFCADPGGDGGFNGPFFNAWTRASGSNHVPDTFIVNEAGNVALVGYGDVITRLDDILESVLNQTWDIEKARLDFLKHKGLARISDRLRELVQEKKFGEAIAALNQVLPLVGFDSDRELRYELFLLKLRIEILSGASPTRQLVLFEEILDEFSTDAYYCNAIAWNMYELTIFDVPVSKEIMQAAIDALRPLMSTAESDHRAYCLNTIARLEFELGNRDAAIAAEEEAIKLAPDAAAREWFNSFLETFRAETE